MPLVTAQLVAIASATPRSRLLTFRIGDHPFPFRAGQAVRITPHRSGSHKHYSIACAPEYAAQTCCLELLVTVGEEGDNDIPWAQPGASVEIDGPLGAFTLPDVEVGQRLLFVAGGTGIAPLRSMINHALQRDPEARLSVLYSARRSDEFAFIDEFRDYEKGGRLELHQTVTREENPLWPGRRGRISRVEFEAVLHEPATTLCFVCGPPAMVSEAVQTLTLLGVPPTLIRTEQWGEPAAAQSDGDLRR